MDWTPLTEQNGILTLQPSDFGQGPNPVERDSTGAPIRIAFADILVQLRSTVDTAHNPRQMAAKINALPQLVRAGKPKGWKKHETHKSKTKKSSGKRKPQTESSREAQSAGDSRSRSSSKNKPN
ncbi:hypothetical protein CkaCkLH20_04143 [Colletotrichum karsti]|uniref:Uncharacterized protein n=1 Tax=Colletotrichum karsti TaxID=1095194 RepID=A0A9P6I8U9_9PEZI|nr:uncharacterized protein CkaCkLH20_04143 [Colletotrichum karsti]KAF9878105.1 hypothetical protein CkaCkLH20_04143 [Colletotrichum karsti]